MAQLPSHLTYTPLNADCAVIPRTFQAKSNRMLAKVGPGQYFACDTGDRISTTLGSCISVCVRNQSTGRAGLNHFMLPANIKEGEERWENTLVSSPARYGTVAMERLLNLVLGDFGKRKDLEIKLFGGANVLDAKLDIGTRNIEFVRDYLKRERLPVLAEDLGGENARKILFDTRTGAVYVRLLGRADRSQIKQEEWQHLQGIEQEPVGGTVDLFEPLEPSK